MAIRSLPILFAGAFLALALSASLALSAIGDLEKPALTMARDYSAADYEKVKAVLERKDCKYLGGGWLNMFTTLRYGGDTIALNQFIEALSLCPNVKLSVNFFRPSPGAAECDWIVTQVAPSNNLVVRINLTSDKLDMEKLYLPPLKAENPPK